ncbi:cytidylate kinase [Aequorivita sublithincola DSM 14238]|uniref:Cytidylate kinase n=1 Tax=Aequorivita sublithincola (strain DSM 14238 / LMG 21431 / ACAM 643 / 9-3) TaxID=746697 RepID=I3YYL6_AEQSU|nr:(d)CMP kinase [Aequorivita sublithincola]AFL82084.1 cytidylate kinase [Aequorivita sublithincola DSM 14238]
MRKITIAIDGYSSTGKSTVAKQLADYLGYVYVDSGAMYRAVTLYSMQNGIISKENFDVEKLKESLPSIHLKFIKEEAWNKAHIFLNGKDVENEIRNLDVSEFVSPIATIHEVRVKLVAQQQQLGLEKGVVMDGRDIGTVVFPNAELKIFMNASAPERAQRRYKELVERGETVSFNDVLKNIEDRDHIDTTREDSPLRKADGAIEIDNSDMNLDDQFHTVLQLAKDRIARRI